jgi:hypothetical protein
LLWGPAINPENCIANISILVEENKISFCPDVEISQKKNIRINPAQVCFEQHEITKIIGERRDARLSLIDKARKVGPVDNFGGVGLLNACGRIFYFVIAIQINLVPNRIMPTVPQAGAGIVRFLADQANHFLQTSGLG